MATPVGNSFGFSGNPYADVLIQGGTWNFGGGPHVLSYSLNINDNSSGGVGPGGPWTPAWSTAVATALTAWSNVANVQFQQVSSGFFYFQSGADLAFTLTGNELQQIGAASLGIFPDPSFANQLIAAAGHTRADYPRPEGDVFLDNFSSVFGSITAGSVGFEAIMHEIGHALGLKHPQDDGGNGRPTVFTTGIAGSYGFDQSIMNSNVASGAGATALTPMLYDIWVIQQLYGANMSYHTGNDVYAYDPSHRQMIWDAGGNDTLDGSGQFVAMTVDLRPGQFTHPTFPSSIGQTGIAFGVTIENAIGGLGDDTLISNDAVNTLTGGPGNDTYIVSNSADAIVENPNEGTDTVQSSVSFALPANVEKLTLTGTANINATGNSLDNAIVGNAGDNVINGMGGNDVLQGGPGNDNYVINDIGAPLGPTSIQLNTQFGGGSSFAFNPSTGTFAVSLHVNGGGLVDGVQVSYASANHNFTFEFYTDQLGTALLPGTYANAQRWPFETAGHPGLSVFGDGVGANTVFGSFTVNAADFNYSGGTPTVNSLSITFEQHADSPSATPWTGTVDINYALAPPGAFPMVVENPNEGIDTVQTSLTGYILPANVENLMLTGSGNLTGTGNALDNVLTSNSGIDMLVGGLGNDTYVVNNAADAITENPGEGTDTVVAPFSYTLPANVENLTLTGSGNLTATGNVLDNVLTGNTGVDTLTGGAGNDSYVVNNAGDVIVENPGEGTDMVLSSVGYVLPANVENLTLTGNANINATGNALDNVLAGNGWANVLDGGGGNDTLSGGAGRDTLVVRLGTESLEGGAGFDTAQFSGAAAAYQIHRMPGGVTQVTGPEGTENLHSVEQAQFTDATLRLTPDQWLKEFNSNGDSNADLLWHHSSGLAMDWTMAGANPSGGAALPFLDSSWQLVESKADFNGDSNSDLIWRNTNGTTLVWTMSGLQPNAGGALPFLDPSWHLLDAQGDFNGDGKSDLLWRNDNGVAMAWTMSGLNPSGGKALPFLDPTWKLITAHADFNGDGNSDLLWRNDNGTTMAWSMSGLDTSGGAVLPFMDPSWKIADAQADFNGDGKTDLLWRNTNGLAMVWTMEGLTPSGGKLLPFLDNSWQLITAHADFNGDGNSDLMWRNTNGLPMAWTMSGLDTSGGAVLPFMDPSWQPAQTNADFTGDGKTDILWQHSSGQPFLWTMDGLHPSAGNLLPNPGTGWVLS